MVVSTSKLSSDADGGVAEGGDGDLGGREGDLGGGEGDLEGGDALAADGDVCRSSSSLSSLSVCSVSLRPDT